MARAGHRPRGSEAREDRPIPAASGYLSRRREGQTVPIYALPKAHAFPDPRDADPSGLIAVGGDLHPERVLLGYMQGIFPWYSEGQPILWHSPDPRFVLFLDELRVQRSLKQRMRKAPYRIRFDTAFSRVIEGCEQTPRPGQDGTWITEDMKRCYVQLHELGVAHSVEAWRGEELVGGLYGVSLGGVFFGESMFARASDASKIAFVVLVERLRSWGFTLVDSQVHTDHLARFGAREIPRSRYLELLAGCLEDETRRGSWDEQAAP